MPPASDGFHSINLVIIDFYQPHRNLREYFSKTRAGGDHFSVACSSMNQPSNELLVLRLARYPKAYEHGKHTAAKSYAASSSKTVARCR
jgi:hypothetical protein